MRKLFFSAVLACLLVGGHAALDVDRAIAFLSLGSQARAARAAETAASPCRERACPPVASGQQTPGNAGPAGPPLPVKILAINDFHGQLGAGKKVRGRAVGSAPVLAAYLKAARRGWEDRSLLVHVGDLVGASPPNSALLQDEPSIMFFNLLSCRPCQTSEKMDPNSDLAATVGNHEFDKGVPEMQRLIYGGNHPNGPFLENPYHGANFPYVAANVVSVQHNQLLFPPYVIKQVGGLPIAFIGAVVRDTPTMVTPAGVAGLKFLDEAEAVNSCIPALTAQHVRAVVVLLHQGGFQKFYQGQTRPDSAVTGPIRRIIKALDNEIDVVLTGHAHSFTNAILTNQHGKTMLVTQAFSAGTAYADITVEIDPATKDILKKSAAIVTTYADEGPGLQPDPETAKLVARADARIGPIVNEVVATAAAPVLKRQNAAGESALGNLIADAQRAAMGTDFAFVNPGGIRTDIAAGEVTWGELFTVQPFNNYLVRLELTGQQIYDLLNRQWRPYQPYNRMLQVSGLSYLWDGRRPGNDRLLEIRQGEKALDRAATYTVTVNSYLAEGGDKFNIFIAGRNRTAGPLALEALVSYLKKLPQPLKPAIQGRIQRVDEHG